MNTRALIKFWGTRGSLARPGPDTIRYGGNTSCVQISSPNGAILVIDCGTGAYDLGRALLSNATGPLRGHILFSHFHWDHIQGFPFFAPAFIPGGHWDIYGPAGMGKSIRETLAGQMEHTYFPLTLNEMGAAIHCHDLVEGSFQIDDIQITTQYLNHPALTLGYRMQIGGVSIVYSCDHEPHSWPRTSGDLHELDRRHAEFLARADLVIHDAQYTDLEYPKRKGWGHSTIEYVCEICQRAGVKQLALSHHDPMRCDDALDQLVAAARQKLKAAGSSLHVFAAADGQLVELETSGAGSKRPTNDPSSSAAPALKDVTVLIAVANPKIALSLSDAASEEKIRTLVASEPAVIISLAKASKPALILLEHRPGVMDGIQICRDLRSVPELKNIPIVLVADHESAAEGASAGVTRWLISPFSTQYARAQIQALLLRAAGRWIRAPFAGDEAHRLDTLRKLTILDTQPEERFDRITRVAAAVGDVPIAIVSLVDENRQWFKSCHGLDATESSREVSFCAHAVASRKPLIVPDTFLDDRFADNPLVLGHPRIRFYAGFPVYHTNGSCLGTLCMIDTRPRSFPENVLKRFEDLANLIQLELNR